MNPDRTVAEKLAVRRPRPEQNRGYIAPGEERLARLRGNETPPDLKELYTIGPFDTPETPYFTGPAAYPSFAANLWPVRPVGPRCRTSVGCDGQSSITTPSPPRDARTHGS